MAEPKKVTQEEYDKLRAYFEKRQDYENMSDEDKERFDEEFDKAVVVDDNPDDDDTEDIDKGQERERDDHRRERDDEEEIR